MVVVVRYINDEWEICQKVARLMLVAHSMTGDEVARQLIFTLSRELGITSHQLIASMRDRASVNNAAIRTVSVVFPDMFDIGAFRPL